MMMFPTLLVRHRDSELFQKTKRNSLVVQWLGDCCFLRKVINIPRKECQQSNDSQCENQTLSLYISIMAVSFTPNSGVARVELR